MQNKEADAKRLTIHALLALVLAMRPLAMVTQMLMPGGTEHPMAAQAGAILRELLLWGLPALALRPWRSRNIDAVTRGGGWAAAALVLGGLTQAGLTAVMQMLDMDGANSIAMPQGAAGWGMAILALAVVPALAEEAFFRGSLLCCLATKAGNGWAFVLTMMMFSLLHGSLAGLPAHLLVSCLCTLLMLSTGRLLVPVMFHLGFNAAGLALPLLGSHVWQAALLIPVGAVAVMAARHIRWDRKGAGMMKYEWMILAAALAYAGSLYFL